MDNVLGYLLLTSALVLLQIRETYNIYRAGEKPINIDWAFSLLELLWLFVSVAILFNDSLTVYEALIPILYVAYNICGLIMSFYLFKDVNVSELDVIIFPDSYLKFCFIYCAISFTFSIIVLTQSLPIRNEEPIYDYLQSNWTVALWVIFVFLYSKSAISRIKSNSIRTLENQVIDAINLNDICSSYFGSVENIELNREITSEYARDTLAYYVIGEKSKGLLIAEYLTTNSEIEMITDGFIETDDGIIIELERSAFDA